MLCEFQDVIRTIRLDWQLGSGKFKPFMSWQVSPSVGEDDSHWLHLAQPTDTTGVTEFAGSADDLARSLEQLVHQASADVTTGGRPAKRVVWRLALLDGDHKTLDRKGASWSRPKEETDDDAGPHTSPATEAVPMELREYWQSEIMRLRSRVRELEEFQMAMFLQFGTAQGQMLESSGKMVEVHTTAGIQLMQGFMNTAEYYFALRQADMEAEIRGMLEEETGFFDTPLGKMFAEQVGPHLAEQLPELLAAFLEWVKGDSGITVTQVADVVT